MKENIEKKLTLSAVLFLFWLLFAGSLAFSELAMGAVVSVFVAFLSHSLLCENINLIKASPRQVGRLLLYVPYLLKEIIKANVDVAERVLRPDLPISPRIVRFRFPRKEAMAVVTMANSITLTPGTLTVDIDEDGVFHVHCLAEAHAESLLQGELRKHVLWVYEEGENE